MDMNFNVIEINEYRKLNDMEIIFLAMNGVSGRPVVRARREYPLSGLQCFVKCP